MDTDLFANLTALSPPPSTAHRLAAARSRATMTTTVSAIATTTTTASLQVDDNDDNNDNNDDDDDALGACESASSSGLQWSAEPSAFTGGVRSHVQQQSPLRMRLALDLSSSAHQQHAFRPERVSISQLSQNTSYSQQQFAELFYADSQEDDVDGIIDTTTTSGSSSATGAAGAATYVTRGSQRSGTRRSPPSTVRFTTESAGTPKTDEEAVRDDAGGARTLSQTPLGGRANQTSALSVSEDVALGAVSTTRDASVVALSNRLGHDKEEKDDGENHHRDDTGDADNDRGQDPRIDSSPSTTLARDEQETERFPDSASDDDSDAFPDTQALSDTETDEGGGEYDMENANTEPMTEDGTEPMETSMGGDGGTELEPADDDDDNDVPQTQPSSSPTQTSVARTLSPVQDSHGKVAPSPGRAALRRRDKTTSQPPLADSEHPNVALEGASSCRDDGDDVGAETVGAPTKVSSASRNLAFSFALPDSQENAPQGVETAPDVSSLGNPASNGAIRPSDTETAVGRTRPPRTRTSERGGGLPRPPIAATATSEVDHSSDAVSTGTSSVESTPTRRTRKRSAPSPDVGIADAPTPAKRATATPRRSQRATASTRTGAGTPGRHTAPSLRTRSIPTTPLAPPSRIVSAHSKNMFKSKYDFCVTGFASDTQAKVVKLIEDHGGRVGEKEILHPTYEKPVVVVATAIAWRKLKFRYAVACGIPVVHPEWLRACVKAGEVVPFAGYFVPSGYSIVHRKFECLPVRPLDVFAGLSFGIPYDVEHSSKTSTKDLGDLIAFLLRACGAKRVVEGLTLSTEKEVDIVLSDEVTKTCRLYSMRHDVPVKNFSWITECIVLQRLVRLDDELFEPYSHENEHQSLLAATAYIGGAERTQVKLYTGELVLVDLPRNQIEHFLLFNVCEILRITRESRETGDEEDADDVMLEVGVVKRTPNSPMLARVHTDIRKIPASQVLRRVIAVSRADFEAVAYKDESMFYYEDDDEDGMEMEEADRET